jgi:hypothetical protein
LHTDEAWSLISRWLKQTVVDFRRRRYTQRTPQARRELGTVAMPYGHPPHGILHAFLAGPTHPNEGVFGWQA